MKNIFSKRNLTVVVVLIYTYLNIRLLYPFLFGEDHLGSLLAASSLNGGVGFLGIVVALFLNAATILYFLKEQK